jgi:large subunit ribosomal protein L15
MRVPRLPGFKPPNRIEYTVVNLDRLEEFESGSVVDVTSLREAGLVKKKGPVKVLGRGDLSKSLNVRVHAFSKAAISKIEAAGGSAEAL